MVLHNYVIMLKYCSSCTCLGGEKVRKYWQHYYDGVEGLVCTIFNKGLVHAILVCSTELCFSLGQYTGKLYCVPQVVVPASKLSLVLVFGE